MSGSRRRRQLLAGDFDFTPDEILVTDADKLTYPPTPEEAQERWQKQLKYDMLVLKADKSNKEDIRERLRRRYQSFAKRMHQTDSNELLEMFLTSITTSFDPHSTYMAPVSSKNFDIVMRSASGRHRRSAAGQRWLYGDRQADPRRPGG